MKIPYLASFFFAGAFLLIGAVNQQASTTTLHYFEHDITATVTDTGAPGDSVGDVETFANPIFDENDKTQIGSSNGFCTRTVVGEAWECVDTVTLPEGQIQVEGPIYDDKDVIIASIVGGTDAFANAQGRFELHEPSDNTQPVKLGMVLEITK